MKDVLDKKSLVSVIVPVYNGSKYIAGCITQVLRQTYKNIELIIINDGSVDNTMEIVNNFASNENRLIILSQENKGVSSARNTGLKRAKGDFITFVDVDDLIETNFIERLYFSFFDDIDIVVSKFTFEDEERRPIIRDTTFLDATFYIDVNYDFKEPFQQLSVAGVMFRSSILQGVLFDTELSIGEDALFFNEILLKTNKLRFISDKIYIYVIHRESAMHKPYSQKKYSEITAWQKICNLYSNMPLAYRTCLGKIWYTKSIIYGW